MNGSFYLRSLLPPLPFPNWSEPWRKPRSPQEKEFWEKGSMALECVYCGSMMGFDQISLLMQTNFKGVMSPYFEETQRELRAGLEGARHILFMGYSLPKDDIFYRSVLAARLGRQPEEGKKPLYVSVVNLEAKAPDRWLEGQEIERALPPDCEIVKIYKDLKNIVAGGETNSVRVRAYGQGVPRVFGSGGMGDGHNRVRDLIFPWGLWQEHFELTASP